MSPNEYTLLLRKAFDDYLNEVVGTAITPDHPLLGYEFNFLRGKAWHGLGEEIVSSELYGLTNILNRWRSALRHWCAWNIVIAKYNGQESWALHWEFLQALAHECLLRPSSIRDAITSVATRALHQVRLSTDREYRDRLDEDPQSPEDRPHPLSRRKKEKQLRRLAHHWHAPGPFLQILERLDDLQYQSQTSDYRNLHSHSLGPRLSIGPSIMVTREVVQADELQELPGGQFGFVNIPGRLAVSYGFGEGRYLNPDAAWTENLRQFELARECYSAWLTLLTAVVGSIKPSGSPKP